MQRLSLILVIISLLLFCSNSITYASVTLDANCSVQVSVFDGSTHSVTWNPLNLPYEKTGHVIIAGRNSSNPSSLLNDDTFSIDFTHVRASQFRSSATSIGTLNFHVDVDTQYSLSSNYSAIDPSGRMITMAISLVEVAGNSLFQNTQQSDATPDESFTLGQTQGDLYNELSGSTTGTLNAYQPYSLTYEYYIEAIPTQAFEAATAVGSIDLQFNTAHAPLPSALWSGAFLLTIIATTSFIRRRHRPA